MAQVRNVWGFFMITKLLFVDLSAYFTSPGVPNLSYLRSRIKHRMCPFQLLVWVEFTCVNTEMAQGEFKHSLGVLCMKKYS